MQNESFSNFFLAWIFLLFFSIGFSCTCSSPMLFSPLTKHHTAGWRSRQRLEIRGTERERESGGGRGGCTLPDRRAQGLILSSVFICCTWTWRLYTAVCCQQRRKERRNILLKKKKVLCQLSFYSNSQTSITHYFTHFSYLVAFKWIPFRLHAYVWYGLVNNLICHLLCMLCFGRVPF